jgi:DoxX-like family
MSSLHMLWIGRALTGIFALFMLFASIGPKLVGAKVAQDSLASLGWPSDKLLLIGLIELACLVLYLIPRTSVTGAVLMMGLLGGGIATHMRVGSPLFSHVLFGVYLGLFMWGGLWLRDAKLRSVFPF